MNRAAAWAYTGLIVAVVWCVPPAAAQLRGGVDGIIADMARRNRMQDETERRAQEAELRAQDAERRAQAAEQRAQAAQARLQEAEARASSTAKRPPPQSAPRRIAEPAPDYGYEPPSRRSGGCGSRGGPGYRKANGKCASWRD